MWVALMRRCNASDWTKLLQGLIGNANEAAINTGEWLQLGDAYVTYKSWYISTLS